jgi:hypothetical protein
MPVRPGRRAHRRRCSARLRMHYAGSTAQTLRRTTAPQVTNRQDDGAGTLMPPTIRGIAEQAVGGSEKGEGYPPSPSVARVRGVVLLRRALTDRARSRAAACRRTSRRASPCLRRNTRRGRRRRGRGHLPARLSRGRPRRAGPRSDRSGLCSCECRRHRHQDNSRYRERPNNGHWFSFRHRGCGPRLRIATGMPGRGRRKTAVYVNLNCARAIGTRHAVRGLT